MTSLFYNTRSKVNVTILHDSTLTADNKRRFERTANNMEQNVSFIDVSEHIFQIAEDPDRITPYLSRGALFRLLIPDLMNVPKVIYLDCDIIVNLDIAELWNISLETQNASLAVVKDQAFSNFSRKLHEKIRNWAMPYIPENYFNSGVLIMNLNRIRANHPAFISEVFRFTKRYSLFTGFIDQDFLNVFFRDDVIFVDIRFNNLLEYHNIDNAVLHFAIESSKPWKRLANTPRDHLFWKILMESEWGEQFFEILADSFQNKSLVGHSSLDCVKVLLRRIPGHLRLHKCGDFFKDLKIIFKELHWRLTQRNFVQSGQKEGE